MAKVSFALLIHSHQPVGNFDHVIEEAYQRSYAPFLAALERHPAVRMSLHFSGCLLEWLEHHHPEYSGQLKKLTARGQVEMVGGGYYEPILPSILDTDKHAQIRKLSEYLGEHFGAEPQGAWVAERVWEPGLARPLAEAGIRYVVLDDTHFLAAGLEPGELHTSYITEEAGAEATVRAWAADIVNVHVEGMRKTEHDHLVPWEGDLDVRAVLATLAGTGYRGPACFELSRHSHDAVRTARRAFEFVSAV